MSKTKSLSDYVDVAEAIRNSYSFKPDDLILSELKWKYLVRSGLRGKNILLVGPTGCGKTLMAQSLARVLNRPLYSINLGATQDPRASLIGNTQFSKEAGTYFHASSFVKAISTPNTIVLLDELSRANPEASNILMSVLDELQRYLRLDEKEGSEIIKVADGVTFVATANVGNEYTATRVMDRALLDRFQVKIEVDSLSAEQERSLMELKFPGAPRDMLENITGIAEMTRTMTRDSLLTKAVSTRAVVEMVSLAADGFSLMEIVDVVVYPDYPEEGGVDSERTLIKQIVQKYTVSSPNNNIFSVKKSSKLPPF